MTLREAIAEAAVRLGTISDTARLDAELLAAHAAEVSREILLLNRLNDTAPEALSRLIDRRAAGEPIAYITGMRDFWTISLNVAPGVLIPRPDSETLIEAALSHFGPRGPHTILDLGTGSGALLLAALDQWPSASGLGIDQSGRAVAIAQANAERLGMADRARIRTGNWADGLEEQFDLVLCNPPYIEVGATLPREVVDYEPASALFAGPDGLDAYTVIAPRISRLLAPGGVALFEIGMTQGDVVSSLFQDQGYVTRIVKDLAGRDRCVAVDAPVTYHV